MGMKFIYLYSIISLILIFREGRYIMPGRMQGHPWHIGYVKAKDGNTHR